MEIKLKMLPRENRLPLRKELQRIQKEGKIFHFPLFSLLVAKNGLGASRFGFIVSNKIHKRATKRNRVKRLLREGVRLQISKVRPGYDFVFLAKKRILGQDFLTVSEAVQKAFKKAGLL